MLRKNLAVGAIVSGTIIGGLVLGASFVGAQDATDPHQGLIQKIAQKFNLSETDVEATFKEFHSEKQAEMKARMEERLNQAVKDGKITDAQKQAIIAKFGEMRTIKLEKGQADTPEERRQLMEQHKQELENWATQNGLTLETLHELIGPGKGHRGVFMYKGPMMGGSDNLTNPAAQ